jgi:hypothetical protein
MQFSHLTILALAATALAAPSALEARNGGGKKGGSGGGGGSSSSPQCTGSQSMMCCKGGIDNLVGIGCVSSKYTPEGEPAGGGWELR